MVKQGILSVPLFQFEFIPEVVPFCDGFVALSIDPHLGHLKVGANFKQLLK